MSKLIIPKTYVSKLDNPLIFLAGPIRSAPNWQDEAIKILFSEEKNLIIASPRRGIREEISKYITIGNENYFSRQRAWERHYLEVASKTGAILFWLPGEEKHDYQKVYGAMTRVELGQWMTNYRYNNSVHFCIGSDGKFAELEIIKFDLNLDVPNKKIFNSLEETCSEALRLVHLIN
jgi:hypothetical protein